MLSISGMSKNPVAFQRTITMNPNATNTITLDEENDSFDYSENDDLAIDTDDIDEPEYTEEDYNSDKSFLEKSKADVENLINTVDAPKPVKTFGKIILGGISVAMGFMSMKWGTLASWKVAQDVITNSKTQKIVGGMTKPIKEGYKLVADAIKDSNITKTVSGAVGEQTSKLGKTSFANTINKQIARIKEHKLYKGISERLGKIKVTTNKVKNFTANFFGVSGGVTAGVETIQASSNKKQTSAEAA